MNCGQPGPGAAALQPFLAPDLRGQTVAGYRIGRLIGMGGSGVVYQAGISTGRDTVAFKALHYDVLRRPTFMQDFKDEMDRWANLDHRNIVRVLDAGRQGDIFFMVSEFMNGVSLLRYMRSREYNLREIRALIGQIGAAVTYAHLQGILHRNLKPSNILVCRGQVKLTDFGLARFTCGDYRRTLLIRSEPAHESITYMAPELRFKERVIDERADVFSMGGILYYLLTEQPPVGLLYPPSRLNPQLPGKYDDYVLSALEPEPHARPDTISDLVKPFRLPGWRRKNTDSRRGLRIILIMLAVLSICLYLWMAWPEIRGRLSVLSGGSRHHATVHGQGPKGESFYDRAKGLMDNAGSFMII
jgi:serine/threonine protein kinase